MFGELNDGKLEPLSKYLKVQQGYAFKSEEFCESGIPVIKIGTVNKGFFDLKTLSYVKNQDEKLDKFKISPNDLLISLTGTVGKDDYGNTCFVTNNFNEYYLNQRVARLIPYEKGLNYQFTHYLFKSPAIKRKIIKANRGVRQANISNEDILSVEINYPSIDEQNKFAIIVDKVEIIKTSYKRSFLELKNLYSSISQRAFKGELDLSKVDISDMEDSKKNIEAVKEDLTNEQMEHLIDSFEHKLPNEDVTSNTEVDIHEMHYLILPDNEETEGIESTFVNEDSFYQLILTLGFAHRSFTFPELEQYARKSIFLQGTGTEFTYENWKNTIFRFIGAKQPMIEQFFDEETKTIKLKLTDEAFEI